ncbi:hypothetical protein CH333_05045 [candidate division WOR-3 bacterium JGI_Cruoil_03_44_89]|uniref:TonB-dependent receptor plug domain-containing protein n=1 Tax=candidate division WOR-3 bacterium JGI_Cruoil_03_44_89 TaxID=1973748 RepID=A0A235BTH5_UNCW3|nr:MAG: hypothetical protein CH333_05045 [candidate division WOR-3 bacterium JGI_Cruoil_03_44_89]
MMGYKTIIKNRVVVKSGVSTFLRVELEEEPIQMKGITVKPSFFEKTKDAIVSSRKMDYGEIISQPGGCYDVQRAVQALPAVVSGTDQNNEVIVRGGNYGENLFLVDNIEITNPNHFGWQGTGGGPVNIINTEFVSDIDFIAGAFPARYGDKTSSVMDIKLRDPSRDRLNVKFDIGMAGAGGSIEGPIRNGAYMISAHRSFLSLIKSSFGLTAVPNYYSIQGKMVYDLSRSHKLIINEIYGNDWICIEEEPSAYHSTMDITIDAKSHQYTLGGTLKSLFKNGYSLLTFSRTLNYWAHYVTDTNKTEIYHNYATEAENSVKYDLTLKPKDKSELCLGFYLKNPQINYDTRQKPDTLFIYDPETGTVIDTTDYVYRLDVKKDTSSYRYGGYIQYKQKINGLLTLTAGLRYTWLDYTKNRLLSPRIGGSLNLLRDTHLNVAYGRCYQPPEWYELLYDERNSRLKSKYTDQYIVGVEHLFTEDVKGTIEAYYKEYKDVPIPEAYTTPDPNDWAHVYVNKGEGYCKGIEFFLQKKVKQNLWGTLSYSYSIARMKDPRYPENEYPWDFDFRNVFTLIAGYRKEFQELTWFKEMKRKWWYNFITFVPIVPADVSEYSFRYRYIGGKPYTPKTYHPEWQKWTVDEEQSFNSTRMPPYTRFDLHLEQRWFLGSLSLGSYFEIENLFNIPNIWNYQYNDDGTKDTIYQYGRMIIGGFIIEF